MTCHRTNPLFSRPQKFSLKKNVPWPKLMEPKVLGKHFFFKKKKEKKERKKQNAL
jgi:hypothetical protein